MLLYVALVKQEELTMCASFDWQFGNLGRRQTSFNLSLPHVQTQALSIRLHVDGSKQNVSWSNMSQHIHPDQDTTYFLRP